MNDRCVYDYIAFSLLAPCRLPDKKEELCKQSDYLNRKYSDALTEVGLVKAIVYAMDNSYKLDSQLVRKFVYTFPNGRQFLKMLLNSYDTNTTKYGFNGTAVDFLDRIFGNREVEAIAMLRNWKLLDFCDYQIESCNKYLRAVDPEMRNVIAEFEPNGGFAKMFRLARKCSPEVSKIIDGLLK